ncbi:MAG: PIN domain-containing protein [Sphingomicrobium sp.]
MTSAVLDSSAVIALLKGERGGAKVASVIGESALGVFNQAEIVSHFIHLGAPIDEIRMMLGALPITVIEADEELAWDAGAMRAITSKVGLSLGDRFCLALARRMNVPAYTADRVWKEVETEIAIKVVVVR